MKGWPHQWTTNQVGTWRFEDNNSTKEHFFFLCSRHYHPTVQVVQIQKVHAQLLSRMLRDLRRREVLPNVAPLFREVLHTLQLLQCDATVLWSINVAVKLEGPSKELPVFLLLQLLLGHLFRTNPKFGLALREVDLVPIIAIGSLLEQLLSTIGFLHLLPGDEFDAPSRPHALHPGAGGGPGNQCPFYAEAYPAGLEFNAH